MQQEFYLIYAISSFEVWMTNVILGYVGVIVCSLKFSCLHILLISFKKIIFFKTAEVRLSKFLNPVLTLTSSAKIEPVVSHEVISNVIKLVQYPVTSNISMIR